MTGVARLFLHIGTHKTGTSAIQAVLRSGRRALRREGIGVVRRLPGDAEIMRLDEPADRLVVPARRALLATIDRHPRRVENFVLSFEGFSGDPYRGYENAVAVADTMARIAEGIPTVVIVYLRRQDEFAESLYAQSVHEGGSLPFAAFLRNLGPAGMDWNALLQAYESRFGIEDIHVRSYAPGRLASSASLIHDFGRLIGSDYLQTLDWSPRVNPSYSRDAIEFARICNEGLSSEQRDELRRILQATNPKQDKASSSFFPAIERIAFLADHRDSNDRVAERYLPPGESLFDSAVADYGPYPPFDAAALARVVSRVLLGERHRQPFTVRSLAAAEATAGAMARRVWRGLRRVRRAE